MFYNSSTVTETLVSRNAFQVAITRGLKTLTNEKLHVTVWGSPESRKLGQRSTGTNFYLPRDKETGNI